MNILVTGATGYIGREFVKHATAAGHELRCPGRTWREFGVTCEPCWTGFDAVVHLAAAGVRRGSEQRNWHDCMDVNFGGTRDLLLSIKASGATPTVFISGSIREAQTKERPDYWSDPYIVSQRLRRLFVEEWAQIYKGRVVYPFCERCGDVADVDKLCLQILAAIQP